MKLFINKFLLSLFFATTLTANAADLSHWMQEKSNTLGGFGNLLITEIAMPGTHDALTYRLDQEKRVDGKLGIAAATPILGAAIIGIAKAQGDNMIGQFSNGSRYFDLRIAKTEKGFEGVHTFYNGPIEKSFRDFKAFLDNHPGEIVLMDINSIKSEHIDEFMLLMKDIFGQMIYPRTQGNIKSTYQSLIASGQRVIFFVNHAATKDSTNLAFDRETFLKSKWHNQRNPKKLKEEIIEFEKKNPRTMDHINVIQAQTTPDTKTGAKSVIKSLLTFGKKGGLKGDAKKGVKYQEELLKKAQNSKAHRYLLEAINVFMVDHLTATHALKIIALNDAKVNPTAQ